MIEPAYERLAELVEEVLIGAGFVIEPGGLKVDPTAAFEPQGDERQIVTAASLVKVQTQSVRQILGRAAPRHVVERQCRIELAMVGPNKGLRLTINDKMLMALALLPNEHPTLDGLAERLILLDQTDDDLPPNGVSVTLTFTIRVRSGDPLGRTA